MLLHLIGIILIGLVVGWLTGKIMKGGGYGFFLDIVLGIAGAFVGGFIASHLHLAGGMIFRFVMAVVGAVLIVVIFRLITGKK